MNSSINIKNVSRKELRKFGITLSIPLGILGGLFLWKKGDIGFLFLGIGGFLLFFGLIIPSSLGFIYVFWMKFAALIGFIMNHLILATIYYLTFTPTGFIMRLIGRDPLCLWRVNCADSYWIEKKTTNIDKENYEKMF